MSRRRYRIDPETMKLVEISADWQPTARVEIISDAHYDGTRATDGTDISTRRRHQEYMHATGYAVSSDFKETWAKARTEKEAFYSGTSTSHAKSVESAVDKSWHTVMKNRGHR